MNLPPALEQIVDGLAKAIDQIIEQRATEIAAVAIEHRQRRKIKHARARKPLPHIERIEYGPFELSAYEATADVGAQIVASEAPPPPDPPAPIELEPPPPDAEPAFAVQLARQHLVNDPSGHIRSKTISGKLRREEKRARALIVYPDDVERPRTRGACKDGPRPCPWVSCAHHLYLDVNASGGLQLNFPHLELEQMKETCALDVADRGGIALNEVAEVLNVSRQRVQQMEARACGKMGLDVELVEHAEPNRLPQATATC